MSADASRIAAAIPEYEVEREVGRGGMGVVYLGRHRRLDRAVAIKELPRSFAVEADVRARFSTEAQTLAGLSHPHIVPIFDYVEREGLCLIVMEQLPGGTVWDRFTETGLTPPTSCGVVMACCAALQYAHDKGVLHLDVKPDNLMFDAEAAVKVTDFGIARVITGDRTLGTVDGQVLGTPAYMSPEQARGDVLTPASDVYACGVMLYELLSGQLPWLGAQSASELLAQRLDEDPIPLDQVAPHLPAPLTSVVMQALSRSSEARYQRAEDLGVGVGEACVASWGEDWLDHAGVAVFGSGRLNRAARTSGAHRPAAAAAPPAAAAVAAGPAVPAAGVTVARSRADGAAGGAHATVVTGGGTRAVPGAGATTAARATTGGTVPAPATGAVAPVVPAEPFPAAPATVERTVAPAQPDAPTTVGPGGPPGGAGGAGGFEVVRAAGAEPRIQGADLLDLEVADLIGVEDVLDPPRVPRRALACTAAFALLALVVAAVGLGRPPREEGLPRGAVELDGRDVASGTRIDLDLSRPVVVELVDRALARRTDAVDLAFTYLDAEVTSASAPVRDGVAVLDPELAQRLVGGKASATLTLLTSGGTALRTHDLPVRATQDWWFTAPAVGGTLLLLLGLANLEQSFKPLRSGRMRRLSFVGASLSGAILGLGLVLVAAAVGLAEPALPGLVAVVVLASAAAAAGVPARVGVARRRRVQRAVRRAEKALGLPKGHRTTNRVTRGT